MFRDADWGRENSDLDRRQKYRGPTIEGLQAMRSTPTILRTTEQRKMKMRQGGLNSVGLTVVQQ
jgi:hypothetical protein